MKETALNLEVLKSSADSLTLDDARFVIESLQATITQRLDEASETAKQRIDNFPAQKERLLYSFNMVHPRFGDFVLPLTKRDAVRLLVKRGLSPDSAAIEWENMVFPERDFRRGTYYYNARNGELDPNQTADIYPVHLLHVDYPELETRRHDDIPYLQTYIDPETAVVDACSLKSYLAWLGDRDDMFDIMLKQHFLEADRQLWSDIISDIEAIMGLELPVAEEHFNYYDNGSGLMLWRETGRLGVAALFENSINHNCFPKQAEIEAAQNPVPSYPLELTPGLYYLPENIDVGVLPASEYLCLTDFHNAAIEIRRHFGVGTSTHTAILGEILASYSDDFYGWTYLRNTKNSSGGWQSTRVFVDASEVMQIYLDILGGQKVRGIGKIGVKIMRQALINIGHLGDDKQTIGAAHPEDYDPADDIEINLDDPDLK